MRAYTLRFFEGSDGPLQYGSTLCSSHQSKKSRAKMGRGNRIGGIGGLQQLQTSSISMNIFYFVLSLMDEVGGAGCFNENVAYRNNCVISLSALLRCLAFTSKLPRKCGVIDLDAF